MRITDLLSASSIDLNAHPKNKSEAIDRAVQLAAKSGNITDIQKYKSLVLAREKEGSTGVGEGIAIPHAKSSAVKKPTLAAMVVKNGVDFDSLDSKSVKLIFIIAAPDTKENIHLDVLGRLSVLLMDSKFSESLIHASSPGEFISIIDRADKGSEPLKSFESGSNFKILAVTACPTGIAHTYMAAEGLEKAAKSKNASIKVETRGSGGVKNMLTEKEISNADCIIVAADTKVPMQRFNGKKVISVPVSDGISKADELVSRALHGDAQVYSASETESPSGEPGFGRGLYKHLMNGVSHMLPFVIGGGILIALAFLFDDFSIDPSNFGKNLPIAAFFKTIGEAAFNLMLPVLAGFIAYSIADRPGLAVGFVGGMLAASGNAVIEFSKASGGLSDYIANSVFNSSGSTVSGFLGALAAGFAAGWITLLLQKLFSRMPKSLDGLKPTLLYPVIGVFVIGALMLFVFNPVIGVINDALAAFLHGMGASSKILLGAVLGAMMAIDMGGPINKAAYVFGTMAITQGNYDIMAAVMVGGMVPPIGIALAATFFKNRFTIAERRSALANYVMGLSFITEGAIPFAAADPLRVIPATALGAASSGALSMLFGCTLRAPHGGIFVFPVVGSWPAYLLSLLVGSAVTAILLGFFKKNINERNR